jgi:hypothetical protein
MIYGGQYILTYPNTETIVTRAYTMLHEHSILPFKNKNLLLSQLLTTASALSSRHIILHLTPLTTHQSL